jgi:hypothetical protein
MARHRTLVRLSRAFRVLAVIVAAAAGTTALFQADLGRGLAMPSWKVATAPPVFYLTIALVGLRHLPFDRKIGWALAACGVNLALGLVSAVTLSLSYPMSLEGALTRTLWTYVPAPIIHLVAAPLVLLGWRSRVVPLRASRHERAERRSEAAVQLFPGPALAASTPDWDAVLRRSSRPARAAGPGPTPFERGSGTAVLELPHGLVAPSSPRSEYVAPMVEPPTAAPKPEVERPAITPPPTERAVITPPPVERVVITSPPVERVVTPPPVERPVIMSPPAPPPVTAPSPVVIDEPVVRVSLLRIAEQLPPDVFVLPPARLAESLREPHVLVVPRRLVVPQLGEGAVEIAWTLVEDQFPELALAVPAAEVRRRFPGWVISLPMDEVVRQIPADLLRIASPAADLTELETFPAPFAPGPPAPETAAEPAAAPQPPIPAVAAEAPRPVALSAAPPPPAVPVPVEVPAAVASSPPVVSAPVSPPRPAAPVPPAPAAAVPAPPAAPPPPPEPPRAQKAPEPLSVIDIPDPDVVDEESEALARTLAVGLTAIGAFDCHTRRVGGRPLASFVAPMLDREAIEEMAAAGAALVEQLAPWALEQVTIRTSRLACVLTPLGTRGCLAATIRRNGSVAMLELVSARAARSAGVVPAVAAAAGALPAVTTSASSGNGQRRLGEAARALSAFGAVASTVADAEDGAPGVYVFADRDRGVLAGVARAVHAALVAGHDDAALGRLESVELRRGRERAVVRPLQGPAGAPAMLAAAGEVALAGRAHRAVARAAALLEAH